MTVRKLRQVLFDLPQDDEVRIALPSRPHPDSLGTRSNFVVASLRSELYNKQFYGEFYVVPDKLGDLLDAEDMGLPDAPYLTIVPPGTPALDNRDDQ